MMTLLATGCLHEAGQTGSEGHSSVAPTSITSQLVAVSPTVVASLPPPIVPVVEAVRDLQLEKAIVPPDDLPAPSPSRPQAVSVEPADDREPGVWALIIGVDDYPGEKHDLTAAVADARAVDVALAAYGVPADHRRLLLDQQATGDGIRAGLSWLTGRADRDAPAVVFFAGHARHVRGGQDGDGEAEDEALVGADGGTVLDGEAATLLRSLSGPVWIGVAACYAAGFDDLLGPNRVLTAASGEDELAYEHLGFGHSFLVEFMVNRAMLQGRAGASIQDSFHWADNEISRDFPDRRPVMIDRTKGRVRLGTDITHPATPAPAPVPGPASVPIPAAESPLVPQAQDASPVTAAAPPQPGGKAEAPCQWVWVWGFPVCRNNPQPTSADPGLDKTTTDTTSRPSTNGTTNDSEPEDQPPVWRPFGRR